MKIEEIKNIIDKKVIGKWEPAHTDEGHFYRNKRTGKLVSSVSTKIGILNKEHLKRWSIRMAIEWLEIDKRFEKLSTNEREQYLEGAYKAHIDVRDDAGHVGTAAHNVAEEYIKDWIRNGDRPDNIEFFIEKDMDFRSVAGARAIEKFFKDNPTIIPVASELIVGDLSMSCAGTLDLIVLWDNELVLVDFKTSNSIDETSYPMQTCAYKRMFEKMTKLSISKVKILHVSKTNDRYHVYTVLNPELALRAFKAVSRIFDWKNSLTEKVLVDKNRAEFLNL